VEVRFDDAIRNGVAALRARNTAAMWRASRERPEERTTFQSPFAAALIACALRPGGAADREDALPIVTREIEYLLGTVEPPGLWRFAPATYPHLPLDADDSACALAALRVHNQAQVNYDAAFGALRSFAPDGVFPTWLVRGDTSRLPGQQNDIDVVVNTNVLYFAAVMGRSLPRAVSFVVDTVQRDGFDCHQSLYYRSAFVFAYCLTRWLRSANVDDAFVRLAAAHLARIMRECTNSLECALALNAALDLGLRDSRPRSSVLGRRLTAREGASENGRPRSEDVEGLAAFLLREQTENGVWPDGTLFIDPAGGVYGSVEVTTALCIEALMRYTTLR
jgi:hypothetical protein